MASAKKTAAKKTAAKSSAKKTAAKKTAATSTAKKTAAKKTAATSTGKKTAAKKTAAKKTAAKSSAKKTAARATSTGGENLIVTSKLREAVRSQDVRMSSDLVEALNAHVHEVLTRAVARAKGNGRGTVRPNDL
ncbi:hypothetical protein [Egicoccus sp. AB-alg6-2]|uniref:hypothetical protein n=1 Tax=Egicoccus sp. AB-alg6-2 TaxID=3242692 RepID=UPI00359D0215